MARQGQWLTHTLCVMLSQSPTGSGIKLDEVCAYCHSIGIWVQSNYQRRQLPKDQEGIKYTKKWVHGCSQMSNLLLPSGSGAPGGRWAADQKFEAKLRVAVHERVQEAKEAVTACLNKEFELKLNEAKEVAGTASDRLLPPTHERFGPRP
jgi:hypothetical protein